VRQIEQKIDTDRLDQRRKAPSPVDHGLTDRPHIRAGGSGDRDEAGAGGPEHAKLKVIIGHLGEGLPFLQWRMDRSLARDAKLPRSFTDYVKQHFWITTSGNFSDAALVCSIAELGIDKVIFSVDYPYVKNEPGRKWLDALPVTEQQRAQIASGNVKKLLKL
jgi:hypothetical protein